MSRPHKRKVVLIFSDSKSSGEHFYNLCAARISGSPTIHVAVYLPDTKSYYSVDKIRGAFRNTIKGGITTNGRTSTSYRFWLTDSAYKRMQEYMDGTLAKATEYDSCMWNSVGILGCFLPLSCITSICTSGSGMTCSRMVYNALRACGAIDRVMYDENPGIMPSALKAIITMNQGTFKMISLDEVNSREKSGEKKTVPESASQPAGNNASCGHSPEKKREKKERTKKSKKDKKTKAAKSKG